MGGISSSFKETLGALSFRQTMPTNGDLAPNGKTEDELRLNKLGYKQEVKRIFGWWTNFGLAASMISALLGVIPLYSYSLRNGGELLSICHLSLAYVMS